jgi:hypothetical protein
MDLLALGSLCGGIAITLFNKALTDGARNGAARLAWFLVGSDATSTVEWWACCMHLMPVAARSSRGGSVHFYRAEHPLLFWITFFGLTAGMGITICLTLVCFWKALKKD